MKKIWIISIAAVLAITLSACGAGDVSTASSGSASGSASSQAASSQAAPSSTAPKVDASSVDDTLAGLQKYLVGNASVTGTPEDMRSDIIGAAKGVRYKYGYGGGKDNVTLELYEFDSSKLSSTAQKVISDVKSSGQFTLMDQKVDGVLSDSGKYLMIYKNSATDETNKAYANQIKQLVKEFKK